MCFGLLGVLYFAEVINVATLPGYDPVLEASYNDHYNRLTAKSVLSKTLTRP
jgi:hypothetical protein